MQHEMITWEKSTVAIVLAFDTRNSRLISRVRNTSPHSYYEHLYREYKKMVASLGTRILVSEIHGDGGFVIGHHDEPATWASCIEEFTCNVNAVADEVLGFGEEFGLVAALGKGLVRVGRTADASFYPGQIIDDVSYLAKNLRPGQVAIESRLNIDFQGKHALILPSGREFLISCPRKPLSGGSSQYSYELEIFAHDPRNIQYTWAEIAAIKAQLKQRCVYVQPIGSATLKGVPTKPRIDIMCAINATDFLDVAQDVKVLGYHEIRLLSPLPTPRVFFQKDLRDGASGFNLHLIDQRFWPSSRERRLYEALKRSPSIRELYSSAKRYIADTSRGDPRDYGIRKELFIRWLEADLLRECSHVRHS